MKSKGTVKGTVKYKGNIVKGGNVSFVNSDGTSASGVIEEDGSYVVTGVPTGTCKVCVETGSVKPPEGPGGNYAKGFGGKGSAPPANIKDSGPPPGMKMPEGYVGSNPGMAAAESRKRRYVAIPDSYAKVETTDLKFEVNSGDNTFDIELK